MIANDVAEKLTDSAVFSEVSAVAPGFLNLKVKDSFVCEYLKGMAAAEKFGVEPPEKKKTIVVDYGGPNVAKPLHVGHLRSAVIGESIKRINVTKDIGLSAMSIWRLGTADGSDHYRVKSAQARAALF